MAHTDPFNTMMLNFVARLKYVGTRLARKSVRSPQMLLLHSLAPEQLASLARSLVASQADHTKHARPPSWLATQTGSRAYASGELRTVVSSLSQPAQQQHQKAAPNSSLALDASATHSAALAHLNGLEIVSAIGSELESSQVSAAGSGDEPSSEDGASASAGSGPRLGLGPAPAPPPPPPPDHTRPADSDADELETADTNDEPTEDSLELDEEEVKCQKADCSDLLTATGEPASSPAAAGSPLDPTRAQPPPPSDIDPIYTRPSDEPPYIQLQTRPPGWYHEPTLHMVNTQLQSNEIADATINRGQHEFIVRQQANNGASSSAPASAILTPFVQLASILLILSALVSLHGRLNLLLNKCRSTSQPITV